MIVEYLRFLSIRCDFLIILNWKYAKPKNQLGLKKDMAKQKFKGKERNLL